MDSGSVMHRWCNKDFGRNNTLTASRSCHSEGRNYFSYSTVFGQWVDIKKNVVVIFDGSTSSTSSKYRLWKGCFPKDVHVFPYDDGGGYYSWHGCGLVSGGHYCNFKDEDFKQSHRLTLLDYYVKQMYERFRFLRDSKAKGCEKVNFDAWGYFEELCSIYKDISVAKYLKTLKLISSFDGMNKEQKEANAKKNAAIKAKKVMVKLLASGERNVQVITDAMFGEGVYQKYIDSTKRFDKAEKTKQKVIDLCHRLGMKNPYNEWWEKGFVSNPYTPKEIRKLTARQRNELHFANLMQIEYDKDERRREKKYERNKRNAFIWVVGFEPKTDTRWNGDITYKEDINLCRNKYTGEVYDISGDHIYGFYWCKTDMSFAYDSFRKSDDKEQWIRNFYEQVKLVQDNRRAIAILKREHATLKEKKRLYETDQYVLDEKLTEIGLDAESLRIVTEFIQRQDAHFAEEAARERLLEIQRKREEEEKERERAYREQVKQEQIDECRVRGAEGCRDIWRLHLDTLDRARIYYMERNVDVDHAFYYGGNVLLRFNLDKTIVETSKGIRIPLAVCRKFYAIIKGWHEKPSTFKEMRIETKLSGTYTISEYKNDILTAGCHDIAWTEIERMWNEIEKLESAV